METNDENAIGATSSRQRLQTGVVIGKFMPPHRGHKFLIETALEQVEHLTIIVCEKPDDPIDGKLRAQWLREIHPTAWVLLIDDWYDNDVDSALWARLTIGWLGYVPDAAFTSENYGEHWAREMGCQHVMVDFERVNQPIGARQIRANPVEHWQWLEAPVRAHFARRVVVLGAESTGTTTLATALAEHYETVWVPEYGREFCEKNWIGFDYPWKTEEFVHIAGEQLRRENEAARQSNRVLICDTDALATRVWHWRYFGHFSPVVHNIAMARRPDLYLLTDDDIPFVQDGLRDGESIRHDMHLKFIEELNGQDVPWELVTGTPQERLERAVSLVQSLPLNVLT